MVSDFPGRACDDADDFRYRESFHLLGVPGNCEGSQEERDVYPVKRRGNLLMSAGSNCALFGAVSRRHHEQHFLRNEVGAHSLLNLLGRHRRVGGIIDRQRGARSLEKSTPDTVRP